MKSNVDISNQKSDIRRQIFSKKREIGLDKLTLSSQTIIQRLEDSVDFKMAKHILFYYALPYEVETQEAIEKWFPIKCIYLPSVSNHELRIKQYKGNDEIAKGSFGVWEPTGDYFEDLDLIDLVIIPGVAFDLNKNRIGYGKGFYDNLLPKLKAKKVGICFDFQLFEQIPTEKFDHQVDIIFCESRIVL